MRRTTPLGAAAFLALFILGLTVIATQAHGIGKTQLLNVPSGPYLVSAWTDPDPLRADETHVVVAVTEPGTRQPIVTGVEVAVTMTSQADPGIVLTEIAGTDNVNQLLYAAEFNNRVTAGRWRVDLAISGERGAGLPVGFEVAIDPARGFNWLWIGAAGLALVVLVWVVGAMRSEAPARGLRRRGRPVA